MQRRTSHGPKKARLQLLLRSCGGSTTRCRFLRPHSRRHHLLGTWPSPRTATKSRTPWPSSEARLNPPRQSFNGRMTGGRRHPKGPRRRHRFLPPTSPGHLWRVFPPRPPRQVPPYPQVHRFPEALHQRRLDPRWHQPRHPAHVRKGPTKEHRPRPAALQRVRRSDCRDVEKLPAHHLTQQKTSPSQPRTVTPRVRMAAVGLGKSYRRSRVPYPMLAVSTAAWGRSTFPATFLTTTRLSATTMSEEGITLKWDLPPGARRL